MVLATFLEGRKVVFDRVQVGRIRRQKEEGGPGTGNERLGERTFMAGRSVHDDNLEGVQEGTECLRQPRIEEGGVTGAVTEERSDKGLPDMGRD